LVGQARGLLHDLRQPAQQRPAAGHRDAVLHQVGREFRLGRSSVRVTASMIA
jgi:hypothetical protein